MSEELEVWEAILLGIVQGLTEWLPVSSSGHLVIAQQLLGIEATVFFDVLVHVGTLLVVLFFFRRLIGDILRAVVRGGPERRLAGLVVVATVPTAIIGLAFREMFEAAFTSLLVVGCGLFVTGTLVATTRRVRDAPGRALTVRDALLIGTAQGIAIFPGVSRSGSTICTALPRGVDRETAVRFSFLLFIPAILGALVLQASDVRSAELSANAVAYVAGTIAAMVVGYATLWALVFIVERGGLHHFAWYCWAAGAATLVYVALA